MAGVRTFSRYRLAILSLSGLQWKYPEQGSTVFPIKPLSVVSKKSHTYRDSGVDIEAGENLVNSIKDMVSETHDHQVLSNIGGFGALFAPDLSGYEEPVFVSSVDGVGTKLIVAFRSGRYDTIGQDLVNHCVNDIAVCGARPLFFLDYFSTGKLERSEERRVGKECIDQRGASG